jgi:phosphoglycolate phosphatase-like HAD superfamily hydrolase
MVAVVMMGAEMGLSDTVLVLFDIDGTLVDTTGAGLRGMSTAFERLHGRRAAMEGVPVAGRTDRAILTEVFQACGIAMDEARVSSLCDVYFQELAEEMGRQPGPNFGVLPGVPEALDALDATPGFTVALLTGNFARGAEVKLSHFDLWRRFRFGAFGDAHVNRRDLVPVALERAHEHGLTPSHVIVVGDTPLDVDCAHAHGALAVAVATGHYTRAALVATGAEIVVDSLYELEPIAERLAGLCAQAR